MTIAQELPIIHFDALIERYDNFLLDAYGVFWESSETGMLPGAKQAMGHLVSLGKKVGILSNTTQLALKEKEKLARHGVQEGVHYHFLITSGEVTKELLSSGQLPFAVPRKKYWLFGVDHPRFSSHSTLFQGSGYSQTQNVDDADFIYIAIPHIDGADQEDAEGFLEKIRAVAAKGIPVLCSNPDRFAHEGLPPRLVVRQGTIAHLFQVQGAPVHFIGKPYPTVYEKALQQFLVNPREILMIGDTPETDIRGARQMGMGSALVTETGIMKERIAGNARLPQEDQPDFAIRHLA